MTVFKPFRKRTSTLLDSYFGRFLSTVVYVELNMLQDYILTKKVEIWSYKHNIPIKLTFLIRRDRKESSPSLCNTVFQEARANFYFWFIRCSLFELKHGQRLVLTPFRDTLPSAVWWTGHEQSLVSRYERGRCRQTEASIYNGTLHPSTTVSYCMDMVSTYFTYFSMWLLKSVFHVVWKRCSSNGPPPADYYGRVLVHWAYSEAVSSQNSEKHQHYW